MARPRQCTHKDSGKCSICYQIWHKNKMLTDPEFAAKRSANATKWSKDNPEARARIAKRRNQKAYKKDPLKIIARACIGQQVKRGNRPAARELPCDTCGKPADHYHHYLGYSQEHRYDVLPLCTACHSLEHQ